MFTNTNRFVAFLKKVDAFDFLGVSMVIAVAYSMGFDYLAKVTK